MKYPLLRNSLLREDLDVMIEHLKQDNPILTSGPNIPAFEEEWSAWLGVKYSVFVSSGAAANLLTLTILKMKHPEGGEVIVPSLTWVSDITTVMQNGFTPVFVDIDPRTLSMDPAQVLAKITDKTRAVFLTHVQGFDGLTDDMIAELEKRHIPLIEDVSQSHGATHNGKKVGQIGWVSNFSFNHAHHISTIEGGMLCTNDPDVYQKARMLRSHGMVRELTDEELQQTYVTENPLLNPNLIFAFPAYNLRNTELGALLGRNQLKRFNVMTEKRTANFKRFLNNIDPAKFWTDFKIEGSSNYALNIILKEADKDLLERLMKAMKENGIEFRRGSAGGGNQLRQPYLKGIVPDGSYKDYPVTDHVHFFGFYIGNSPDLRFDEIDEICAIVNAASLNL